MPAQGDGRGQAAQDHIAGLSAVGSCGQTFDRQGSRGQVVQPDLARAGHQQLLTGDRKARCRLTDRTA